MIEPDESSVDAAFYTYYKRQYPGWQGRLTQHTEQMLRAWQGAEHYWRAAERQRIKAILDFHDDAMTGRTLMNAAEETLP